MRTTRRWNNGLVRWEERGSTCISVAFTWLLKEARNIALHHPNDDVVIGGPAAVLRPDIVADWCSDDTPENRPLWMHNPHAGRATIGCNRGCPFCAVGKIEGAFCELEDWQPKPIMCDSNFLLCSDVFFDDAIDRLKQLDVVDFNQGLDSRFLTKYRARRLTELNMDVLRLAWDMPSDEEYLYRAVELLESVGFPTSKVRCYILINYRETLEEALYRFRVLKDLGLRGFAMRYQPLDSIHRNDYVAPQWTDWELKTFTKFWNKQRWLGGMTFEEYCDFKGTGGRTQPGKGQKRFNWSS